MSKIVKKKDLDVLIESTLEKAGIVKESKFEKALEKIKKDNDGEKLPKPSEKQKSKLQLLKLRSDEHSEDELISKIKEIMNESKFKEALETVKKSGKEYPKKEDLSKEQSSKLQLLQLKVKNNPEEYTEDELVSKIKEIMEENISSNKSLINEELARFNKLSNYTYKK
jgi:Mn-containing catalase